MHLAMSLFAFFRHVLDSPFKLRNKMLYMMQKGSVFSRDGVQSDSESTRYQDSVRTILESEAKFRNFRRRYNYREILEHVTYGLGKSYLEKIDELRTLSNEEVVEIKKNDVIGKPRRYFYKNFGLVSPTTIRYSAVALEIERLFGSKGLENIAEIGCGYGGQARILDSIFKVQNFDLFDLKDVQHLIKKYLGAPTSVGKFKFPGLKDLGKVQDSQWDLVISNYAFSELPADLQREYLVQVIQKSKRGYMIMNSGQTNKTGRSTGKLSIEEIREYIPNLQILPEVPLTGPDNYLLVWGSSGL